MNSEKPFNLICSEFVESLDIEDQSREMYRFVLSTWSRWLMYEKIDVRKPRRADLIRYKIEMLKTKRVSSVNFTLSVLRSFYKYLEDSSIYANIAAGIKNEKRKLLKSRNYLNEFEIQKLLSSIERDTVSGLRDFAMINLMIRTGMRRIEVSRLDVTDVDEKDSVLHIQRKGSAEKIPFGVSDESMLPISEYLSMRGKPPDGPLFVSHSYNRMNERLAIVTISRIAKKYLKQCGMSSSEYTTHSFRHTATSIAVKAGADIFYISNMLGHTKISTTEIYLRALSEQVVKNNPAMKMIDDYIKKSIKNSDC